MQKIKNWIKENWGFVVNGITIVGGMAWTVYNVYHWQDLYHTPIEVAGKPMTVRETAEMAWTYNQELRELKRRGILTDELQKEIRVQLLNEGNVNGDVITKLYDRTIGGA